LLDKSIPYLNIIMKRPAGTPINDEELPVGFSFAPYSNGKEQVWANIETSVGEFETEEEALSCFREDYLLHKVELQKRLTFIQDIKGNEVGTITSWWNYTGERRDPSIHWLAVKSEFQGRGLAKSLVSKAINTLIELEGDKDIYLHTQTWSYTAIALYQKAGFEIVRRDSFGNYKNDYEIAKDILKQKIKFT
jgi:ribosomal protein S18 acetylase RimI-like enzyme